MDAALKERPKLWSETPDLTPQQPDWVRRAPAAVAGDPVAAARALRPLIEQYADEGERINRLPDPVARALVAAGMFGLIVPRELGGAEVSPRQYIDIIEELSYADGSTGWVVLASGFGIAVATAFLGDVAMKSFFEDEGYTVAGQLAPTGKAWKVDGGYRISGRFQFASGSQLACWLFGAFVLQGEDGKPVMGSNGKPKFVWAYAPRRRFKIVPGSWDTIGLRATESVDYTIENEFVTEDFTLDPAAPRRGGPFFDIGVSIAHVSWSLGVAMRALDEIKDIASRKRRPGRSSLIDQQTFHRDYGMQRGALEACRSLIRSVYDEWYAEAEAHGGKASLAMKAKARMAACWATRTCLEIGRFAFQAGGSDGARNKENNVLQRCYRDLSIGSTHKHVDENILMDCATVLLGVNDPNVEI
jgi:alkylation response protein AidB-like acyl-CoA dehydrogenase